VRRLLWYCQVPMRRQPVMSPSPKAQEPLPEHRQRLLEAMSHAVAGKGYADTTINDIAALARVSKRTFYEHFGGKAQCLVALYEAASHQAIKVLKQSLDPQQDWHGQVEQALRAYFETLASNPVLLRTLFIEILGLGAEGLAARRRVNRALADFIVEVVYAGQPKRVRSDPLVADMAMGIVGGINELVLQAIEDGRVDMLAELTAPASRLVRAVTKVLEELS
jgi:AcrR family transcriptional regulator